MTDTNVDLENRLRQAATVFTQGVDLPSDLHASVMARLDRQAPLRPAFTRELAVAAALALFVGLLGFGFSKLHRSPTGTIKPTPKLQSGVIPWKPDPMVLFPGSAEALSPADAANRVARIASGVSTILTPQAIGGDYQAEVLADANAFTIDYTSATAHATVSLVTPGIALPAASGGRAKRTFRGVSAVYQAGQPAAGTGPRSLWWTEPGTAGTPYTLMSDGLSETVFWQIANSLQTPSVLALRPCRATDLYAIAGHGNGAGGQIFNMVEFTDRSTTPCQLEGTPRVLIQDTNGHTLALPQGAERATGVPAAGGPIYLTANSPAPDPLSNPSAGTAAVIFSIWDCPSGPAIGRVLIALPNSAGTISIGGAGIGYSRCDNPAARQLAVDPFIDFGQQPVYVDTAPLTVTVQAHDAPRAGSAFHYNLVLTNSSRAPFYFHDCPSYTEWARGVGGKTLENYSLNCKQVGWLAPGASVTFAMVIQIPAGTAGDRGSLQWEMRSPFGGAQGSAPLAATLP